MIVTSQNVCCHILTILYKLTAMDVDFTFSFDVQFVL